MCNVRFCILINEKGLKLEPGKFVWLYLFKVLLFDGVLVFNDVVDKCFGDR